MVDGATDGVDGVLVAGAPLVRSAPRLLVVCAVAGVPAALLAIVATLAADGRSAVVINGWVVSTAPAGVSLVPALIGGVVGVVGGALTSGACSVVVAGALLGRRIDARSALSVALRRLPSMLVVIVALLVGVVAAVVGAAALWAVWKMPTRTPNPWRLLALAGSAVLLVGFGAEVRLLVALPVTVLEARGWWSSLRRAWRLTRRRSWTAVSTVLLGVIVIPALVQQSVRWGADRFGQAAAATVVLDLLGVLAPSWWATVLTVVYFNQARNRPDQQDGSGGYDIMTGLSRPLARADRVAVVARLPAPGASAVGGAGSREPTVSGARVWAGIAATGVAVLVPGLVEAGYVVVNPAGLAVATDQAVVTTDLREQTFDLTVGVDGGRPLLVLADSIVRCTDPGCRRYSHTDGGVGFKPAAAAWPDGTVTLTGWTMPADDRDCLGPDRPPCQLTVRTCRQSGCNHPPDTAVLAAVTHGGHGDLATAVASTPAGGLVVVYPDWRADLGDPDRQVWRLASCPDPRCRTWHTVDLTVTHEILSGLHGRPVAVAVSPDGRPVAAIRNEDTVEIVACDSPACAHPITTVTTPAQGRPDPPVSRVPPSPREVTVAVAGNGRPVIATTDPSTGAALLLVCRTSACVAVDAITVTGAQRDAVNPALAIDRTGRPVLAVLQDNRLAFIACNDSACTRRDTTRLGRADNGISALDLTIGADNLPRIAWSDATGRPHHVHLLTCPDPRCHR
jgi:hypothetical protein